MNTRATDPAMVLFDDVIQVLAGADPDLPAGFAPFGIANIDGVIYVTYALQNPPDNHDDRLAQETASSMSLTLRAS